MSHRTPGLLTLALLAPLLPIAAWAKPNYASLIDAVYVFGDSAVDAGNWNLSPPLPKKDVPYYFRGRFADSYNWADMITMALVGHDSYASGPFTPPYVAAGTKVRPHGTNYAYGGAVSGSGPDFSPPYVPSMLVQAQALLSVMPQLDRRGLYFLSGGGNNFVANSILPAQQQQSNEQVATAAAADIVRIVSLLAHAGARNFLVNVSSEDSEQPEPGGFQQKVTAGLDHLAAGQPWLHIVKLDTSEVFRFVAHHAGDYRIGDPIRSCYEIDLTSTTFQALTYDPKLPPPAVDSPSLYTIPGVCPDVTQHLLIDGYHNTAEVQAALAHAALDAIDRELLPILANEASQ